MCAMRLMGLFLLNTRLGLLGSLLCLVGHSEIEEAGIDGPLTWSSRAFHMELQCGRWERFSESKSRHLETTFALCTTGCSFATSRTNWSERPWSWLGPWAICFLSLPSLFYTITLLSPIHSHSENTIQKNNVEVQLHQDFFWCTFSWCAHALLIGKSRHTSGVKMLEPYLILADTKEQERVLVWRDAHALTSMLWL